MDIAAILVFRVNLPLSQESQGKWDYRVSEDPKDIKVMWDRQLCSRDSLDFREYQDHRDHLGPLDHPAQKR